MFIFTHIHFLKTITKWQDVGMVSQFFLLFLLLFSNLTMLSQLDHVGKMPVIKYEVEYSLGNA